MNYCTDKDVEVYAEANGQEWAKLDTEFKKRILAKATMQISLYHNQGINIYSPWGIGKEHLRQAAIIQSIFLIRGIEVIESRELARAYTTGEMDDDIIIATPNGDDLCDVSKSLIDYVLKDLKVKKYNFQRG